MFFFCWFFGSRIVIFIIIYTFGIMIDINWHLYFDNSYIMLTLINKIVNWIKDVSISVNKNIFHYFSSVNNNWQAFHHKQRNFYHIFPFVWSKKKKKNSLQWVTPYIKYFHFLIWFMVIFELKCLLLTEKYIVFEQNKNFLMVIFFFS